jgi:hypothetical protein
MGIGDVFWLLFMLSAVQPVLQQKMREASRLRVLSRFERKCRSRAIALVHRQETMSFLGFPIVRYIDINDSEAILRATVQEQERPISTEMPDEVYEFMHLFSQPFRARPAVEYVPMRYGSRQGGRLSPRQP